MSQVWVALMWTLLALIDDLWLTLTLLSFHSFYTETALPWLYKFKVFILSQFGLLCSAENVDCYIWTMRDTSSDPVRLQVSRVTIASKYKHLPPPLNTVSHYIYIEYSDHCSPDLCYMIRSCYLLSFSNNIDIYFLIRWNLSGQPPIYLPYHVVVLLVYWGRKCLENIFLTAREVWREKTCRADYDCPLSWVL